MAEAATALRASEVLALLRTPQYVAMFATGNRDTSRIYNVFRKIYRIENGEFIELKDWFQCSWCDTVMNVKVATGNAQLSRHIPGCLQRPENYVLPERNENRASRHPNRTLNVQQIPAPANNPPQVPAIGSNLVQGNTPPPNVNAGTVNAQQVPAPANNPPQVPAIGSNLVQGNTPPPNVNAGTVNVQQISVPAHSPAQVPVAATCGIIDNAHLASVLARISEIGALYGCLSSDDFMQILPPENGLWNDGFFDRARRLASKRRGICVEPRILLERAVISNRETVQPISRNTIKTTDETVQAGNLPSNAAKKSPVLKDPPTKRTRKSSPKSSHVSTLPPAKSSVGSRESAIKAKAAIKQLTKNQ
ncbi:uncharacterized protein LOC129572143 [Sitodiplosis mosellana]|uniref:uncharacterized protein LOC129572143 n=1 Tax=Sitodiplosis mosellana TaxID=263140 RepID=UPI00244490B5|nr:uncharacterized protein LOC129572143 [Sitodiplosis mosellana]XP_055308041.1 uncharacterized protein LOC129572143 [Sitodiplosis mosellana]